MSIHRSEPILTTYNLHLQAHWYRFEPAVRPNIIKNLITERSLNIRIFCNCWNLGIGGWGKNLVRWFNDLSGVVYCCHTGTTTEWVAHRLPDVTLIWNVEQILHDDAIDALVIATLVGTHHQLIRPVLQADKDVFMQKPLVNNGK